MKAPKKCQKKNGRRVEVKTQWDKSEIWTALYLIRLNLKSDFTEKKETLIFKKNSQSGKIRTKKNIIKIYN